MNNSLSKMSLWAFIRALQENARKKYVKKAPKKYAKPHQHPGVRNVKVAAQMNAIHERWFASRFA